MKWIKALKLGYVVLETLAAAGVKVKGVDLARVAGAVDQALTSKQTVFESLKH